MHKSTRKRGGKKIVEKFNINNNSKNRDYYAERPKKIIIRRRREREKKKKDKDSFHTGGEEGTSKKFISS